MITVVTSAMKILTAIAAKVTRASRIQGSRKPLSSRFKAPAANSFAPLAVKAAVIPMLPAIQNNVFQLICRNASF